MSEELEVGARLKSATCPTEVVVVKAPSTAIDLRCGGSAMTADAAAGSQPLDEGHAEGTVLGKRYTDEETGVELLAVKAGGGSLSVDGRALTIKGAKPLPSSD